MYSLVAFVVAPLVQTPAFELRSGDRIAIVGNALAERMLHDGSFEARVQLAHPELGITVRNLGFAGDEVVTRQRTSGFGTPDEHLEAVQASVVLVMFGQVESFRGPAGSQQFGDELAAYVRHIRATRFDEQGDEGVARDPEVVLVAPIPFEDLGDPLLPHAKAENARIDLYADVVRAVSNELSVTFVDARAAMRAAYERESEPLTIDGIRLNERGNAIFAAALARALCPNAKEPDAKRLEELRALVAKKDAYWFRRHHVADGYNVYGERSMLEYDDVTNRVVMQRELEWLDATCTNLDRGIWDFVLDHAPNSISRMPLPALMPVKTNRPGDGPDGTHRFLTAEEAIARMTPGAGLEVNLFADESRFPDIAKPVQMSFDARGRLWVAVWPTYPNAKPDEPARDKLVVLEDVDGDGRADTCTPFVSDLNNPTGFEFWNGGVYVATAPHLLFLRDTDGDGVADQRERVLEGLGSADTHHAANSFVFGPEGALYFQEGIFHRTQVETVHGVVRQKDGCVWRYEPRTRRLERYAPYGFLNPHGHVFDRWGRDFVTDGTGNENFDALPISGHLESPLQHPPIPTFFRQRSRPAAGTELVSGAHFAPDMQGDYLIANVIGFQGIFRYALREDGSGFGADEREPIVHSADTNFRPVDMEIGPDGALYFLDWQNPLIGHMQHHLRDPNRDHVHGRVYRVTAKGRALAKPTAIAGRPTNELVLLLMSPEDRVRYRVRAELSSRPTQDVVSASRALVASIDARDPDAEHHVLEALWLQAQHHAVDWQLVERVLRSKDPRARAAAVRVARNARRQLVEPLPYFEKGVADEHARVRLEALVALSDGASAKSAEVALRVLSKPMDANLEYALTETMRALEPWWRAEVAKGGTFASGDERAQAWILSRTETEVLLAQTTPSAALHRELLGRYGLDAAEYETAARGLASARASTPVDELLAAIERADATDGGHTDHLLSGLFQALPLVAPSTPASILDPLRASARRASTRRLAIAACIDAGADPRVEIEREATAVEALEAVRYVRRDEKLAEAFPFVVARVEAAGANDTEPERARFLRAELPGERRTLTLAEVEAFVGATNVAPRGAATQSTTNWGGVASRAIDGNASGAYGDGGQTHTIEERTDPWWELDLGVDAPIERVVVRNRTDERFGERLRGVNLVLLDADRREIARRVIDQPGAVSTWDLVDRGVLARRAAARALSALAKAPQRAELCATVLAAHAFDPWIGADAIGSLVTIPIARWPASIVKDVAPDLTRRLVAHGGASVDSAWLALADALTVGGSPLEASAIDALRRARRGAGPKVALIRPVPDSLTYDRALVTVAAGRPVELVFENVDIMPHNLVVTARGALAKVGIAAEAMSASPDAWSRAFVPEMPEVLHASKLLQPGETQTIAFTAPTELGDYPYVCTFPGHWIRMNGILRVVANDDGEDAVATTKAAPQRAFVRNWKIDDLAADVDSRAARDVKRGRTVLEAASCLACHTVDDVGGKTGPNLRDAVARYTPTEILLHVLEPSMSIAPEYTAEIFQTVDGRVLAGRIVTQDAKSVRVQVDPYGGEPVEIALEDVEERATSKVSVMPSGLLSTFERAEILDLVAYLASLKR